MDEYPLKELKSHLDEAIDTLPPVCNFQEKHKAASFFHTCMAYACDTIPPHLMESGEFDFQPVEENVTLLGDGGFEVVVGLVIWPPSQTDRFLEKSINKRARQTLGGRCGDPIALVYKYRTNSETKLTRRGD